VIEAIEIGDLRSDRPIAGKLSPENFGLLQQNLLKTDILLLLLTAVNTVQHHVMSVTKKVIYRQTLSRPTVLGEKH
jgi:hypothetical protein